MDKEEWSYGIIMKVRTLIIASLLCQLSIISYGQNKYELPEYYGQSPIFHLGYSLLYDEDNNIPIWVAWELNKGKLPEVKISRHSRFKPDPELGTQALNHDDYTNSGYDRGHMCPARDCCENGQSMLESFYMSNVCPQKPELNRKVWGKIEDKCDTWALNYFDKLYICCGPIMDGQGTFFFSQFGNRIWAPYRFFKVVVAKDRNGSFIGTGFIMNQEGHAIMTTIDYIESIIGIDLFHSFPYRIEKKIESRRPSYQDWPELKETVPGLKDQKGNPIN